MITAIKIDEENFKAYSLVNEQEEENKGYLDNLSKINIFIGENNSGKSRFLRTFFCDNDIVIKDRNLIELNDLILHFKNIFNKWIAYNKPKISSDKVLEISATLSSEILEFIKVSSFSVTDATNKLKEIHRYIDNLSFDEARSTLEQHIATKNIKKTLEELIINFNEKWRNINILKNNRIYIPILRGLRTYARDYYLERTKKDYFKDNNELDDRIFTGLNLYNDCKNLLLGAKEDRDKIRKFEEFLSECFFDGKDVNLIPSIKDDVLHVRIGSQEYPVSQLGDGIQSVIILTYPLFFNQGENMLFFFEEPEQCLHPAYQRVFMETLMREEFNSFQYFFTTHSNHLLDITLDIDKVSIYTFKKTNDSMDNPTFEIENVDNENTDILRLIGVRNSSVFLSNCTIWVEGITDRIYIRKYLEVYQKTQDIKFLEDIHYSFVEYGGGNITHWSFLEDADPNHSNILVDRLCGKLFLITDKDGAGQKKDGTADEGSVEKKAKYERHIKLKEKLGDKHYHCLEAREIENILSTDVLKKTVEVYEKNNPKKIEFTDKFNYETYKDKPLGKFLNDNITHRKRNYAATDKDTSTINDKVLFSKRAVEKIESMSDLSEEAKELTEKLYEFIKFQNGNKDSVKTP